MARSRVLQASVKGALEKDFERYLRLKGVGEADAVRTLLTLALRIELNNDEDVRPSSRELLENIYRRLQGASAITDVIFGQTFDTERLYRDQKASSELRQKVYADIDNKVDEYLEGKKEKG